jgi:hypothetical protein
VSYSCCTEWFEVPLRKVVDMNPICCSIAALIIAVIFYVYRAYLQVQLNRQKVLRERVAYLLWVVAERVKNNSRIVSLQ